MGLRLVCPSLPFFSKASRDLTSWVPGTGCFAHYLTRRKHDSSLLAFQKGIDWLGTYDLLSSAMWNEGEFALQGYLPYMLVGFFPLFGERGMGKVERDSADWDVRRSPSLTSLLCCSLSLSCCKEYLWW